MNPKNPFFLKTYFLFAMITIAIVSFLYIQDIIFKLEETSIMQTRIFARFSSNLGDEENIDKIVFEEIIRKIRFPIIVTDINGNPVAWRNLGNLDKYYGLKLNKKQLIEMDKFIDKLDRDNKPIEIKYQDKVLAIVHYGSDILYKKLQFAPFFQLIVSIIFLVLGIYGYMLYRKSQENYIWAGMAKETAHQIGTPLSSLVGWIEIMKKRNIDKNIVQGIIEDIERLDVISNRFNKIGSPLTYELVNISDEINEVINYFKKRIPNKGKGKIEIIFTGKECFVPVDKHLFRWALENLLKNSIDALKGFSDCKIEINLKMKAKKVYIYIKDNGKGIEKKNMDKIFNAGFSTKERGWGIGLPLAKKIIEEFHGGKLKLDYTLSNRGTTFIIILNLVRRI